jgi:hypothetical protein
VQEHTYSFVAEGTPQQIWDIFLSHHRKGVETEKVRIQILNQGDEAGNGMVRYCRFPVPQYLMSGGVAQSWEWITEAVAPVSWRYDAVGKPLWSRATGLTTLEEVGPNQTRITFKESYEVFNPLLRTLLERRVHRFLSKDNEFHYQTSVNRGLAQLAAGEPL